VFLKHSFLEAVERNFARAAQEAIELEPDLVGFSIDAYVKAGRLLFFRNGG